MIRYLFLLSIALPLGAEEKSPPGVGKSHAITTRQIYQVALAEIIVTGQVLEIEKDTIAVLPRPGALKEEAEQLKVAVIKIDQALMGGHGLTQVRVAFSDEKPKPKEVGAFQAGGIPRLEANQAGAFLLNRHHSGDYYVLGQFPGSWDKRSADYTNYITATKKIVAILDDPKAALQAKEATTRAQATKVLLILNQFVNANSRRIKEIELTAELSQLILQNLIDLPFVPKDNDFNQPHRRELFYLINPEEYGYKPPKGVDQKAIDADQVQFLKDNMKKIKLQKPAKK